MLMDEKSKWEGEAILDPSSGGGHISIPANKRGRKILERHLTTRSTCHRNHQNNSVQFSCSVMSDSLRPHGLQHASFHCPLPTPGACSSSCPSSWWYHPTISSSAVPFSSCLQSFPASGSFPMNQFFASGSQSSGASASASVLPMNIQDWFPLGWTGWISLQSKGLSGVFSNTTVKKHQFFGAQLSFQLIFKFNFIYF